MFPSEKQLNNQENPTSRNKATVPFGGEGQKEQIFIRKEGTSAGGNFKCPSQRKKKSSIIKIYEGICVDFPPSLSSWAKKSMMGLVKRGARSIEDAF